MNETGLVSENGKTYLFLLNILCGDGGRYEINPTLLDIQHRDDVVNIITRYDKNGKTKYTRRSKDGGFDIIFNSDGHTLLRRKSKIPEEIKDIFERFENSSTFELPKYVSK